jgi:hypothetical protein
MELRLFTRPSFLLSFQPEIPSPLAGEGGGEGEGKIGFPDESYLIKRFYEIFSFQARTKKYPSPPGKKI